MYIENNQLNFITITIGIRLASIFTPGALGTIIKPGGERMPYTLKNYEPVSKAIENADGKCFIIIIDSGVNLE